MYNKFFKRVVDITFSLLGLLLLSPVITVIIIILFIANKGNPFFYQLRPGKNEKLFKILKFKTMNDNKDLDGNILSDKERLTTIGKIVRKFSLDEIPQLINVLKGDMSLVGPRPLLVDYLVLYNNEQKKRHFVKPGITGWAQVNGRNSITWQQLFKLDVWYVENQSFLLDLKIILKTILKVVKTEGINVDTNVRTFKFKGNDT